MLAELTEPTAEDQQKNSYNRSGTTGAHKDYSPAAGLTWAVLGLVLNDVVVPDDEVTLVAALEGLAGITSVVSPRFWGQAPSSILAVDHELRVIVVSRLTCMVGYSADLRAHREEENEIIRPPVNKKFMIINCVIPAALDESGVAALELAVEGVSGVTTCEHLIGGVVPVNGSSINLNINTKMRIDPI